MIYVIPLGNPGDAYVTTRHNVAWILTKKLCEDFVLPSPIMSAAYSGRVTTGAYENRPLTILFPETYMNHSGSAAIKLLRKDDISSLVVVHDELDIPLGTIKVSFDRGAAGHNGVASIIEKMGSRAFVRIRIGIAPLPQEDGTVPMVRGAATASFVLQSFTTKEHEVLMRDVYPLYKEVMHVLITEGLVAVMNRYN